MKDSALPDRPLQFTDPDVLLPEREERLHAIRTQAETFGRVDGPGIRPASSPMPLASVETGYYGIHLLKEPQWSWEIPIYFFAGGAAGAAAVIAEFAQWTGAEAGLVEGTCTGRPELPPVEAIDARARPSHGL